MTKSAYGDIISMSVLFLQYRKKEVDKLIFGKHINRYYLKYAPMLFLGVLALLLVDFMQLKLPELYGMVINGIKNGRQYVMTPNLTKGGVAFYDGADAGNPNELEAACFINAILGKGELKVTAEQAACVTRILEGIYESEKAGKPYYFD